LRITLADVSRVTRIFTLSASLRHDASPRASHDAPPAFVELRRREPTIRASGVLRRVVATKQLLHISDCLEDASYKESDADFVRFVDLCGARSFIAAPMLKDDELVGTITVFHQEVRPFTDKQIGLFENFAAQAVIRK
jgi:two-component system NtrC family sensor kinase